MSVEEHPLAKEGFPKEGIDLYHKARPKYPDDIFAYLYQHMDQNDDIRVVEVGSGSGIFTNGLLSHPGWNNSISELRAIDPNDNMRRYFSLTVQDERVSVVDGTFQSTGVPASWADVVVIAQAYHWCVDHEGAMQEFARILKPGGILSLVWNNEDRAKAKWVDEVYVIHEAYEQGSPKSRYGLWRQIYETPSMREFTKLEERIFEFSAAVTSEIVVNRFLSMSFIAALNDEELKAKLAEDVRKIVKRGNGLKWVDKDAGVFEYPYQTLAFVAHRL